ncbi:MAG TPA: PaaI family thioesterase [Syntrophomonadaceae bacterium]|nr:PaaI family thioesterase [Syntrophomonadaceae bacterium]HQD90322.1 PaaI family thioesterase [Syntrophomonadaceae bacterium]
MTINLGIDTALFEYICQSVENTPFYKMMGIYLTALGPGEAEIQLKATPQHTNPLGLLHGGVLMSIADAAMGNAIRSLGIKGVTADCSTSFIASASLYGLLQAKGKVVKAGKRLVFARAEVFSNGQMVADVKGTFANVGTIDPGEKSDQHG